MSNDRKRILITGASGFIGRHIIHKLISSGYDCIALLRNPDESLNNLLGVQNCITGPLEKAIENSAIFKHVSCIVHCAARVHQMVETAADPAAEYRKVNQNLTILLAERALASGITKFVFLSTVKVMGDERISGKIFDEKDTPHPSDPYGESKFEAEKALERLFNNRSNASCVTLRLPMVYGEGNKGNMSGLLKAASRKIPLPVKAATGRRSMIYVGNIANAVETIISSSEPSKTAEAFYLTDGVDYSSAELYSTIYGELNNGKTGIFYVPEWTFRFSGLLNKRIRAVVSRLFDEYRFSSELFQKRYSWTPPFTLKQGIRNVVIWYKSKYMV